MLLPMILAALLPGFTAPADTVPLYTNLGTHHHEISSHLPGAQEYFDQGLRLVFGFNHGEAIRAFRHAAELDPDCAICYWGVALAYGPHVNAGMDSAAGAAAWDALQQARQHMAHANPREQDYITALTARYASPPPADRARLDSAYATAMGLLVSKHPDDLDAATLFAESLMDLRPWNYWQKDGQPYPGTPVIIAQLERVIAADPNHPGACHYYIHAVEAVDPAKAIPCAERLASLMPGEGHMVHMPAHIYIRVGRYNDAIDANIHAVHEDEVYIEGQHPQGVYPVGYYPHNLHFLSFAATMAGRSQQAIDAAKGLVSHAPFDVARAVPLVEGFVPYLHLTYVSFGRWNDVLALPVPPSDLRFATGEVAYARGVAFAATGHPVEAQAALDTVRAIAAALPEGDNKTVMLIAQHALMGEMAQRAQRWQEAANHFQAAVDLEDGMLYFEPPNWYYPMRHSLGLALLKAGNPAGAQRVYEVALRKFPENGWALFGLAQAYRAQGQAAKTADAEARFRRAWAAADVTLTDSRF